MNHDNGYLFALQKRIEWLKWGKEEGKFEFDPGYRGILPTYLETLERGDTFFMNDKFCSLVEHARQTVPDDLIFDQNWMQSKSGWLWLDIPFPVPDIVAVQGTAEDYAQKVDLVTKANGRKLNVSAIGWFQIPEGTSTGSGRVKGRTAGPGATMFCMFQDFAQYGNKDAGFGCWSYFMLQNGDRLIDRIRAFEEEALKQGGAYIQDRTSEMNHEMRWLYAALFLMSQRLATTVSSPVNRAMRRQGPPEVAKYQPFIRVVTLRRYQEEREQAQKEGRDPIEWNWQWEVRGHWRNQFYPSTGEYKTIFIEAFIKGPENKPLKPPGHKLFIARR